MTTVLRRGESLQGREYEKEVTQRTYQSIIDARDPLVRALAMAKGLERYLSEVGVAKRLAWELVTALDRLVR